MMPLASSPFSCCVHPNRGLSTCRVASHSMTRFHYPPNRLVTYPAIHSRGPSRPIGLRDVPRQVFTARPSANKVSGRGPKSP